MSRQRFCEITGELRSDYWIWRDGAFVDLLTPGLNALWDELSEDLDGDCKVKFTK